MSELSPDGAPYVDRRLAEILQRHAPLKNTDEQFMSDQSIAAGFSALIGYDGTKNKYRFLKQLMCGHFVVTNAINHCGCPRCGAMLRAGYDWDAFRHLGIRDDFEWPQDPLRRLHEQIHGATSPSPEREEV